MVSTGDGTSHPISSNIEPGEASRRHYKMYVTLSRLKSVVESVLLIGVTAALLIWWHTMRENAYLYEDAYISFRYAVHLADGHGLVWNIGGEPTQGYTNFLFVVLMAVGVKLGIAVESVAHLLNLIGAIGIAVGFYLIARQVVRSPFLQVLPGLIAACNPLVLLNAMTGMETVFWCALIAMAAALAFAYVRTERRPYLFTHAIAAFLACLTRPESVLFALLWFSLLFVMSRQRRIVLLTAVAFGIAGLVYVGWLHLYFGAVLPNSFYVKVGDASLLPGRGYVEEFLGDQIFALGLLLVPLIGLVLIKPRILVSLLLINGVVATLLGFYVFTSPLMGFYHRFLLPVAVAVYGLIGIGLLVLTERIPSRFALPRLMGVGLIGALCLIPSAGLIAAQVQSPPRSGPLDYVHKRIGNALAALPDRGQITVAYHDAGILPFYSGVRHLDTVGLNGNEIAREGRSRGWLWVVGYVLGTRPDVIGFYTFPDGTVYNYGHGVMGGYYSVLADSGDFKANYTFVGAFDGEWVHLQWFVWNDSPRRSEIERVFGESADFREYTLKMP